MNEDAKKETPKAVDHIAADYEAPAIESVVTAGSLEREVQYAGSISVVR